MDASPLRELVVEKLQEAIMFGSLPPGQRLVETELGALLGVSRAPIREAINELRGWGLVETTPRRGSYVRHTGVVDIAEIYEVRAAVEIPAICGSLRSITEADVAELDRRIAAMLEEALQEDVARFAHEDLAFHKLTYAKCPNQRLLALVEQVEPGVRLVIARSLVGSEATQLEAIGRSHHELRNAIETRDPELVALVFSARFEHDAAFLIERLEHEASAEKAAG